MTNKIAFLIIVIYASIFGDILDIYDSYRFDETDSTMSSAYTGPIFATGGADKSHYIKEMEPTKIGFMEKNQIVIIGDLTNEIYTFDSICYYEVTKNNESFYIIKILASYNNSMQDIIIELRHGDNFDRTMTIYKNQQPDLMILWIDNSRLKQKPDREI